MDYERFQHSFRAEGQRLAESAARNLDAPVPTCPGWKVSDVVRHTGTMYLTAARSLTAEAEEGRAVQEFDGKQGLIDWYTRAHGALRDELARREPPVVDSQAAFWFRRMAHEAAVHRSDVEMAVGTPGPIEPELAVDGIGEALEVLLPLHYDVRRRDAASGRTVGVRCHQHTWRVTLGKAGVEVSRRPGFADAAVDGEPSEVLLYLWGRRPGTVVSRTGDRTVLAAFRTRLAAAML